MSHREGKDLEQLGRSADELRGLLQDGGAKAEDLVRFDAVFSRRRFFGLVGKGTAATAVLGFGAGAELTLNGLFGRGLLPAAWAEEPAASPPPAEIPGKPGINVLEARPINAEYGAHMLDDEVTPIERHFVRQHGMVSERAEKQDLQGWALVIDGEVNKPLKLSMDDLKKFPEVSMKIAIECAGNGRGLFNPPVRGNPWTYGAVGCSEWTGVRLRDVLKAAELKSSAVYTGHYGDDPPLAGNAFSRGIPIAKAMDEHTLIAYKMNGQPIPALHGFPTRLVVPGWVGSCSQKWLNRIWVRDKEHDSDKMTGKAYRVPPFPYKPGQAPGKDEKWNIVTAWSIKSMITSPAADGMAKVGQALQVRGFAWAGEDEVDHVEISTDFGATWQKAKLNAPANKYAWQRFMLELTLTNPGYYEIWARAFDNKGRAQPFVQVWNPPGYLGNMVHRVPVTVVA